MAVDAVVELASVIDPATLAYYASATAYYNGTLALDVANASASSAAGAAVAAFLSLYAANRLLGLARNYYNLYDSQRQYYYSEFQNNTLGELGLANDTFAIPFYTPQYIGQASIVEGYSGIQAFNFFWWANHGSMYHGQTGKFVNDAFGTPGFPGDPEATDIATIISDFDTYMYRYEEHRQDFLNERTWEWKNQSLNFGVKQANVAESGLATSFPFVDKAMGTAADFFATQSNGLARFGGYRQSLASEGARFAASSHAGRGLAFSTSLGVDRDPAQTFGISDNQGYYKPQPSGFTQPSQFEMVQ